jgi:hypothetical protein
MVDQNDPENAESFNCSCSMITNRARWTREIKSMFVIEKVAFNKKKASFANIVDLNLRKRLVKCYILSIALYGAGTWTLRIVDQKYMESFEMWCWRGMEKIGWTDRVRNEVLRRVNEERNILQSIKRKKANWIGHILGTNCLLKHVIEGKLEGRIEVTGR